MPFAGLVLVCAACSRPGLDPESFGGPSGDAGTSAADGQPRAPDAASEAGGDAASSDGSARDGQDDPRRDDGGADSPRPGTDASTADCGDVTGDPTQCGACDHACPGAGDPDVRCSGGTCAITGCTLGARGGHSYAACSTPKNWEDARTRCQELGLDLADIEDAAEQVFVKGLLGLSSFWIGLNDRNNEGDWYFVDPGGDQTGRLVFENSIPVGGAYVPWASLQPDGFGDEDCVVMQSAMGDYNDQLCTLLYGFICESY